MTKTVTYFMLLGMFVKPSWCLDETGSEEIKVTYQGDQNLCPQKTHCTVLSECRLLLDLMDKMCLLPNRMKDLTCGYRRTEAMVCCPYGGDASPFGLNYQGQGVVNVTDGHKLNENCGKPHLNGWRNGYAGLGSQPWVAKIGYKGTTKNTIEYPCCGSIITNKVILTAAHCAVAQPEGFTLHSVRIGDYDARSDPDCTSSFCAYPAQDIDISHVVVHPGFEKDVFRHDIALLVLKTRIKYSGLILNKMCTTGQPKHLDPITLSTPQKEVMTALVSVAVQPICLLQNQNIGLVGRKGKLVGWGKLAGQNVAPQKEQQIELPVIALEHCSKIYGRVIPITSNHLCVGGEAKKDACSGFGGAPLVMLDHYNKDRYYQVGMLSFGSDKCGSAGIPSVHTRIQHYYDWINANIPK